MCLDCGTTERHGHHPSCGHVGKPGVAVERGSLFPMEEQLCESGWTGDHCTFPLFHEGPHANE